MQKHLFSTAEYIQKNKRVKFSKVHKLFRSLIQFSNIDFRHLGVHYEPNYHSPKWLSHLGTFENIPQLVFYNDCFAYMCDGESGRGMVAFLWCITYLVLVQLNLCDGMLERVYV